MVIVFFSRFDFYLKSIARHFLVRILAAALIVSPAFMQIYIYRSITKAEAIDDWVLATILVVQLAVCIVIMFRIVHRRNRTQVPRSILSDQSNSRQP